MVGEGVVHECLKDPRVASVLVINRKPCGIIHPKLKEVLHPDFFDLSPIEGSLAGYDACFFCLGVSSVGMPKADYFRLTYTLTMHVAQTLSRLNSGMTFCYVSGAGTDSSEKGRLNWARVKGKTENELFRLPFKAVFAFRPGYIHPTKGLKRTQKLYTYFSWMYPILRKVFPNSACTLREVGLAMIRVAAGGYDKKILEVKDIIAAAKATDFGEKPT
ncbi:MAG: epimerase [Bacteroidota bacterium]|nr:epimerase [Bacteroidota bacterium]MDP4257791.1 epimerase [Bacteroidota bacterium]